MKVVILAGGLGTRLAEETEIRPKPMVEIGGVPILRHIMDLYAAYGHDDFLIALGYKGEVIKRYFLDHYALSNHISIDLESGATTVHDGQQPPWRVDLVDTGSRTQTGGRIARMSRWLGSETFMVTYGDGLANVDLHALTEFHRTHGKVATVTAVHPPARFGALQLCGKKVVDFAEKPQTGEGWINGGFFVFESRIFKYLDGDDCVLELDPLRKLCMDGELMAFCHDGFWQPMDTLRDKRHLESYWQSGNVPWRSG